MMQNKVIKKVIYKKPSSHGIGAVPVGAEGEVLLYVDHPVTKKLLVDFSPYGKVIVPMSSVKVIEEDDV